LAQVKRQYVVEQDPTRNQRLLVVAVGRFGQASNDFDHV